MSTRRVLVSALVLASFAALAFATPVAADDLCARACAHNATLYNGNPEEPDCLEDCKARRFDPDCALKTATLQDLARCARGRSLAAERREPWSGARKMYEDGRKLPGGSCDQIATSAKCNDFTHEASLGHGKGPFCRAFTPENIPRASACPPRSLGTCLFDAGENADHYYSKADRPDAGRYWSKDSARRDCEAVMGVWVPRHLLPGTAEARRLGPPHEWDDPRLNK